MRKGLEKNKVALGTGEVALREDSRPGRSLRSFDEQKLTLCLLADLPETLT